MAAWISLIALVAAIVIGVVTKRNVGLIAVIFAFIVGYYFCGMSMKNIYVKGWPTQVFFTSIAVMLLFGVAQNNGTMEYLVDGMVSLTRGNDRLLPPIMFVGSFILCALGAGVPFSGALLPIAFAIAVERNIDPLMMCLTTALGIMSGGLSPLAIHGSTAISLGSQIGVENYGPVWACMIITSVVYAIAIYFIRKGYKIPKSEKALEKAGEKKKMNGKQITTLVVIGIVVLAALIFDYDIGLIAFAGGALLLLLGCGDEKAVIKGLPWNIMLLIGGCSILVNVVNEAGGIALASDGLSAAINADNSCGFMVLLGGVLSAVSSAVGVVMPTLFPTAGELAATYGIPAARLAAGIVMGSCLVVVSPMSTIGGISLASIPEKSDIDRNKFFVTLLLCATAFTVVTSILGLLGVYNLILG